MRCYKLSKVIESQTQNHDSIEMMCFGTVSGGWCVEMSDIAAVKKMVYLMRQGIAWDPKQYSVPQSFCDDPSNLEE